MTADAGRTSVDEDRTSTRSELIAREPAETLAGLLDIPTPPGDEVPFLWHWLYLLDRPAQRSLGPDGHPVDGIPAPPGPGRRRMFAGGRIRTLGALRFEEPATRTKCMTRTVEKRGRSGPLTFATARTEIRQRDRLVLVEEQDIVYRPAGGSLPAAEGQPAVPSGGPGDLHVDVDPTLLFRFSALTYNAHRIHYDRAYAAEEGYPDLVVHGPLQVLMMGELLRRRGIAVPGLEFSFRLVSPMLGAQRLTVLADDADGPGARVVSGSGTVTATAVLRPSAG
jgi:3-methylfumaryl-CoA hydratase